MGLLFYSDDLLPVDSLFVLQFNLPQEFYFFPIAAVVQVVRAVQLKNNKFGIAVKMIKVSRPEVDAIIGYACTHVKLETRGRFYGFKKPRSVP